MDSEYTLRSMSVSGINIYLPPIGSVGSNSVVEKPPVNFEWWLMSVMAALERLKKEDQEFKARVHYMSYCLNNNNNKYPNKID